MFSLPNTMNSWVCSNSARQSRFAEGVRLFVDFRWSIQCAQKSIFRSQMTQRVDLHIDLYTCPYLPFWGQFWYQNACNFSDASHAKLTASGVFCFSQLRCSQVRSVMVQTETNCQGFPPSQHGGRCRLFGHTIFNQILQQSCPLPCPPCNNIWSSFYIWPWLCEFR